LSTSSINAHWAFYQAPKHNDFLQAITVPEAIYTALINARDTIRTTLRAGFGNSNAFIAMDELFEKAFVRTGRSATLRPRFRMQGSCAYHTLNDPAQPTQKIDLDDGVFIPTEFIAAASGNRPAVASKGYFQAVEAILLPLCNKKGWKLITDKDSCVRVEIGRHAHIDLPLYAVPENKFVELTELISQGLNKMAADAIRDSEELQDEFYKGLPLDQIMLAHRENGWQPSDPRKIEDWFQQAIDTHGYVLRRLCRYYKAWRDFEWSKCKLSSLAIMACLVDILDRIAADMPDHRDDVAILLASERFADRLKRPIPNPVMTHITEVALDRDWTAMDRTDFVAKAMDLHKRLTDALRGTDNPATVLRYLRNAYGSRMTDDVSVIRAETREATVRDFPKVAVAAPLVRRSTSG
jgi:hypothetical protein